MNNIEGKSSTANKLQNKLEIKWQQELKSWKQKKKPEGSNKSIQN